MKECCRTTSSETERKGRGARVWIVLALLVVAVLVISVFSRS